MAKLKTTPNDLDVGTFLDSIPDIQKRSDSHALAKMMETLTGAEPVMWGPGIVGFGHYHYRYESGRENDWFLTGFSPRKQALTLYLMDGFNRYEEILSRLGKFRHGKSCLYIKRLADIDETVLEELIRTSVKHLQEK